MRRRRTLAIVTEVDELRRVLAARRRALGISQLALDDIAGLQSGYVAKLEAGTRNPGPISLPCWLGALGLKLAVVTDPNAKAQAA